VDVPPRQAPSTTLHPVREFIPEFRAQSDKQQLDDIWEIAITACLTYNRKGGMALSFSFHFSWDSSAVDCMGNWADDVATRLEQGDRDKQRAEELRLHEAEVVKTKGSIFFHDLMESAKRGVAQIKTARREPFSQLSFQELNVSTFKVTNLVYPAVTVEVRSAPPGIEYSRSVLRDAGSDAVEERGLIEFKVDSADNLCLIHKGRSLAGKDEVTTVNRLRSSRLSNDAALGWRQFAGLIGHTRPMP